jgi:hypothetical protein
MFVHLFLYAVSPDEVVIVMRNEMVSLLVGLHSVCLITVCMFVTDTQICLLLHIVLNYHYHEE